MKNSFLVNYNLIDTKIAEDGRSVAKICDTVTSAERMAPATLESMRNNKQSRFYYKTIVKAALLLNVSPSRLIRLEEQDENKQIDLNALAVIMKNRGIKNEDLGKISFTDTSSISKYFNGKAIPSPKLAYCYAAVLGIDPSKILKDKEESAPDQPTLFCDEGCSDNNNDEIMKAAVHIAEALKILLKK